MLLHHKSPNCEAEQSPRRGCSALDLLQEVGTGPWACSFPWRQAILTLCLCSPSQPSCHCSVSTTQPRAPWTDFWPFPASARALIENLGGLAYLLSWNAAGYIFLAFSQQCSIFNFKPRQWEEKPVPISRQTRNKRWLYPGLNLQFCFINCNYMWAIRNACSFMRLKRQIYFLLPKEKTW